MMKAAWTLCVAVASAHANARTLKSPGDFDWNSVSPSQDLQFVPCYDDFTCTRLRVPLDWLEDDLGQQQSQHVVLAIIKLAAVVSQDDATYGGGVIVNPGGPGDSGVLHLLRNGPLLQDMMDSDDKHFDILSFDPRGMGFTTPPADCFATEAARQIANSWSTGFGSFDPSSNDSLARQKSYDAALSLQCAAQTHKIDGFTIQEYMSTASVARDVLHMVDKMDELRRKAYGQHEYSQYPLMSASSHRSLAKLQYYGTSYGTVLGQFFLSMYPGRVHRMVLDGVVHPGDWVALDLHANLVDTTKAFDYFYQRCFAAGSACALHNPSDSSWHDIKARIEDLMDRLDMNPVAMADPQGVPFIIQGSAVRGLMMDPIYAPVLFYEELANTLASVLDGNYTGLSAIAGAQGMGDVCQPRNAAAYKWMANAGGAVVCGDADNVTGRDFASWREYIAKCERMSPEIGRGWAASCMGWTIRPRFRFTGPFTSPPAESFNVTTDSGGADFGSGDRPSAPVLFLSGRIDPVTPLINAHRAAKLFPGATVLTQNSVGHCTILGGPSKCTSERVGAYMATGKMPAHGTECEADCTPFQPCPYPLFQLPR